MTQAPNQNPNSAADNAPVDDKDLYLCFRLMKEKDFLGAKTKIEFGIRKAHEEGNLHSEALYLSAMGILAKLKKDFKELNFRFTDTGESFSSIKLTIQLLTKSESISPGLNTPSRCSLTYLWNWSKSFE